MNITTLARRLAAAALVAALAVTGASAASAAKPYHEVTDEGWLFIRTADDTTGEIARFLAVRGADTSADGMPLLFSAICEPTRNAVVFAIDWRDLMQPPAEHTMPSLKALDLRLDGSEPWRQSWHVRPGTSITYIENPLAHIGVMQARDMTVVAEDAAGATVQAHFDLAGLDEAVGMIREECLH